MNESLLGYTTLLFKLFLDRRHLRGASEFNYRIMRGTGCYFNSGGYGDGSWSFTTGVGNTFDNRFNPNPAPVGGDPAYVALNPIATTKPPPLIPPLPTNCVVISPYSTQTSLPPCSRGRSQAQSKSRERILAT